MMNTTFLRKLTIVLVAIFFASCDKDYNTLGSDIVGNGNFGFDSEIFEVSADNQNTGPVQSNNLPINSLGYYNNSVFGKSKASLVTQLQLETVAPIFYDTPSTINIDSVYIYVPYYSTLSSTDATSGDRTYEELDSILPIKKADRKPIKLSLYRSGYVLRDYDPASGFNNPQIYYSDQQPEIDAVKGTLLATKDDFQFENTEIKLLKNNSPLGSGTVKERLAPGLFFNLDAATKDYFETAIIQASSDKLVNNNAFKEYFRGLYIAAEDSPGNASQGTMARMNFSGGSITIVYHDHNSTTDANSATVVKKRKTIVLKMSGNTVNLLNDEPSPNYVTPYTTPIANADKLYLKGGQGSIAVLDLFGGEFNKNSADLNRMRNEKWLINDASITFYVDQTAMGATETEPNRVYLYDLTNKRPLIDYYYDSSTSTNSKYNKFVYGGLISENNSKVIPYNSTTRGAKYKIRITNYIKNLIKNGNYKNADNTNDVTKDSTNVKLGLIVTENINTISNATLKSSFSYNMEDKDGNPVAKTSKYFPVMSVVNPLGTVLYGGNYPSTHPYYDKRIKLEIYYTKPN
ncbi:DUF4270 domain-containing protein [Flavobacterium sp.]|uniref:DUF4270 domain-containing protein n=1 Tax=Flavobacterium sp. TaxID=239 RepID=UPI003751AAA7